MPIKSIHIFTVLLLLTVAFAYSQGRGGRPPQRFHEVIKSQPLKLIPADATPPEKPDVAINVQADKRHIISNAMPNHKIGTYPTRSNPNSISSQHYDVKISADPKPAKEISSVNRNDQPGPPNMPFGFAINGIFFEPGTAEFWHGDRTLGWNYEALGGAVPLGIDANHGHVQPNGAYHYHGLPTGLLEKLKVTSDKHSPLIGWASDGYPIYARYGYKDTKDASSDIVELHSSYRLKKGNRPNGDRAPGGKYDGAFTMDYEYVAGHSQLDECNGRFTITPDFPEGTYAYFLTKEWPVIPRAFRAEPINIKMHNGAGGDRPGGERPGRGGPSDGFMKHEDRNGDGKVSKSEFHGPKEHFKDLDKNKDGYISKDEAPTGPPPERPR